MTGDITGDDHALARDLAAEAGGRLVELRAHGGDPDVLRKAGDRLVARVPHRRAGGPAPR